MLFPHLFFPSSVYQCILYVFYMDMQCECDNVFPNLKCFPELFLRKKQVLLIFKLAQLDMFRNFSRLIYCKILLLFCFWHYIPLLQSSNWNMRTVLEQVSYVMSYNGPEVINHYHTLLWFTMHHSMLLQVHEWSLLDMGTDFAWLSNRHAGTQVRPRLLLLPRPTDRNPRLNCPRLTRLVA